MNAIHCSAALHRLAVLRFQVGLPSAALETLLSRQQELLQGNWSARVFANTVWALARMKYSEQPFLQAVSPISNWEQLSALDVAHTVWAFAALLFGSDLI